MISHLRNRRDVLRGVTGVAGVAALGVVGVGMASGWLRPASLLPAQFVDRFEQVSGRHSGFRRNHAKGLAASGQFISNGAGIELSKAPVFSAGSVPVAARFSLSGGLPDQPDKQDTVRGLALSFEMSDGQQWRTAMVNLPVFPDSTPEGFYERIVAAKADPATGKPNPKVMAAFLERHPETAAAMALIKKSPPSSGFGDSTFRGLNTFLATNARGRTVAIRWAAVPVSPPITKPQLDDQDCLFDALIEQVRRAPLKWQLLLTVADPRDPTHDATLPWPADRRTIDVGVITIDKVETEAPGNARDINFDPTVLPVGLATSDDPLPSARSAVYAVSFNRRARELKSPSAVSVEQVLRHG